MRFGPVPVGEAEGATLAHSTAIGATRLRKGHRLNADDIAALRAAGVADVVVASLEPGDLDENLAAAEIASGLRMRGVVVKPAATGRVNLHAASDGLFVVDRAAIDGINRVDPAITIATVPDKVSVTAGQMVATVKIIPFAVASRLVEAARAIAAAGEAFAVHPYAAQRVAVIQTVLPGVKPSVLDKTVAVTSARLARSAGRIVAERRTPHDAAAVAAEIAAVAGDADMVLVFGASAVSDAEDVIPAAIRAAGGEVLRTGMPVDPGNLLVLGRIGGRPVIGAPGCARSPKENGFDWVLDRLAAGLDVDGDDIAAMGVGGLLMEIPTRPQPREPQARAGDAVHAVLLAAGRSSRMGGPNKLLARFGAVPLVRRAAERLLASRAASVTVVTGHQGEAVRAALAGLPVALVDNPAYASGLASSLKAGIAALPAGAGGALVALADMPHVTAADHDRLIAAFVAAGGTRIVRATHQGRRGNPVILPRGLWPELAGIDGDEGARHLVEQAGAELVEVDIGAGADVDVDTREAMHEAGGVLAE